MAAPWPGDSQKAQNQSHATVSQARAAVAAWQKNAERQELEKLRVQLHGFSGCDDGCPFRAGRRFPGHCLWGIQEPRGAAVFLPEVHWQPDRLLTRADWPEE